MRQREVKAVLAATQREREVEAFYGSPAACVCYWSVIQPTIVKSGLLQISDVMSLCCIYTHVSIYIYTYTPAPSPNSIFYGILKTSLTKYSEQENTRVAY